MVGLARRQEQIEALAQKLSKEKGKLFALKVDVSVEEDILTAFEWIKNNLGPVHILINNAGVAQVSIVIAIATTKDNIIFATTNKRYKLHSVKFAMADFYSASCCEILKTFSDLTERGAIDSLIFSTRK